MQRNLNLSHNCIILHYRCGPSTSKWLVKRYFECVKADDNLGYFHVTFIQIKRILFIGFSYSEQLSRKILLLIATTMNKKQIF